MVSPEYLPDDIPASACLDAVVHYPLLAMSFFCLLYHVVTGSGELCGACILKVAVCILGLLYLLHYMYLVRGRLEVLTG